jgi:FkbM family methyltransferase
MPTLARAFARAPVVTRQPGWFFDLSEGDPSIGTAIRREIWRTFAERALNVPTQVMWYDSLRLQLHLGNDLSKCIFVGGSFEPNEFAFLRDYLQHDMAVIDVGANEGVYTLFAASRVGPKGRVVAVEPSSRELIRLRKNLDINALGNVLVAESALGEEAGEVDLAVAEPSHAGQNTVGRSVSNPKVTTESIERVRVQTLDEVVSEARLRRVDFIKIDAEGAELNVLRGARRTLERFTPVLQLEIEPAALAHHGVTSDNVTEELTERGYGVWVFDEETGLLRHRNNAALSGNIVAGPSTWRPPAPHGS